MRKLSDAYISRQVAKIDEMYEKCTGPNLIVTPRCLMPNDYNNFTYGSRGLLDSERKEIQEYYKQLQDLSYVRGFWAGWTLREGVKE
jgi:hypothetical protein